MWNGTRNNLLSQRACHLRQYRSPRRLDHPLSHYHRLFRHRTPAQDRWSLRAQWKVRVRRRVNLAGRDSKLTDRCSRIGNTIRTGIAECGTRKPANLAPGRSRAKRTRSRCAGRSSVGVKLLTNSSRSIVPQKMSRTGRQKWPWPVRWPYLPRLRAWTP